MCRQKNGHMIHHASAGNMLVGAKFMATNDHGAVAIVDDDPAVLDALKFLLELAGYVVDSYASATAFLENHARRQVCLILDQHMPLMTGLELAAHLRAEGSVIPILLITGAPSPAIIARAEKLGVEKVLAKPPAENDLLSFIEAYA
jgi:two-component system, LuxR family, response regulator FixJ